MELLIMGLGIMASGFLGLIIGSKINERAYKKHLLETGQN